MLEVGLNAMERRPAARWKCRRGCRRRGSTGIRRGHLVAMLAAALADTAEAVADLDALDRVDAHQRRGEIAVELAVDRLAPGPAARRRRPRSPARRPNRRTCAAVHVGLQLRHLRGIRPEERVVLDLAPRTRAARSARGCDSQPRTRTPCARPATCLAITAAATRMVVSRALTAPAAARIADAVFLPVGVVGVRRGGTARRCSRSPCCAGRCCGSAARSACRW
jgi:hypothetical protein